MSALAISDNLRDVLEDIVAAPKQRLFAGTCLARVADSFHAQPQVVRPSRTGLSFAEQHLLRVHREELSRALLHGFYNHFFAEGGPAARQNLHGVIDPEQTWKRNAHFARDNAMPAAFTEGTASWLHRLLQDRGPNSFEDYHWLAVAAETLTGSSTAQLYRGLNYDAAGQTGRALTTFTSVRESRRTEDRRSALEKLSVLDIGRGDYRAGIESELEALSIAQEWGDEVAMSMNLARVLVLVEASPPAQEKYRARLAPLAIELKGVLKISLARITEMDSSSPFWQGLTCGILDRLGAPV